MLSFDAIDLKLFLAVAQAQSVSRGASNVHLAPSSASTRLAVLEKQLGVRLFERKSRGVELTAAGALFQRYARTVVLETEHLETQLVPYRSEAQNALRVASNLNASSSSFPNDLGHFMLKHPEVVVNVTHFHRNWELLNTVALGEADLGVTGYAGSHPELHFHAYRSERLAVMASAAHPLALRSSVRFEECLAHEFVGIGPQSALMDLLNQEARALGSAINIKAMVGNCATVLGIVASGAAVTVLPASLPIQPGIRMIPLEDEWSLRRLRLCWRDNRRKESRQLASLIEFLRAERD